jgi:hypothetical protein
MIHQLFYVSSIKSNSKNESLVDEIVRKALTNNPRDDITGILLLKGGVFLQLLEGPVEKVQSLFKKIERDPRHSNVIRLFEVCENERIFPLWSMGFKELTDLDFKMVNEILSWNKLLSGSGRIDNVLIRTMLKKFSEK